MFMYRKQPLIFLFLSGMNSLPSGESLPHSEVSGQTQLRRGGYYTRAKKTWLMGKLLGLEYPGTDEEAIKGLELKLATFLPEDDL